MPYSVPNKVLPVPAGPVAIIILLHCLLRQCKYRVCDGFLGFANLDSIDAFSLFDKYWKFSKTDLEISLAS